MQKILVCGALIWAKDVVDEISQKLNLQALWLESDTREEFYKDCDTSGRYADIVAIYRHNTSADSIGIFDADLIKHLPQSVKFICHNGAGYDQIDVQACSDRHILVSNTPSAVDDATATTATFLILSCLRQYWKAQVNVREGKFKQGLKPAHDPEGKVLGIIGMGGIGTAIAKRALGFDMKIHYHNRNEVSEEVLTPLGGRSAVTYHSDMASLLQTSDVVALSLPLNAKTAKMFGKERFAQMKKGAVLVNTARGGVLDEEALLEALHSGHLSSCGLDVFPDEPNVNPALIELPNVTLLPHVGTETEESQRKMEIRALDNIVAALQKGVPQDLVFQQRELVSKTTKVNGIH